MSKRLIFSILLIGIIYALVVGGLYVFASRDISDRALRYNIEQLSTMENILRFDLLEQGSGTAAYDIPLFTRTVEEFEDIDSVDVEGLKTFSEEESLGGETVIEVRGDENSVTITRDEQVIIGDTVEDFAMQSIFYDRALWFELIDSGAYQLVDETVDGEEVWSFTFSDPRLYESTVDAISTTFIEGQELVNGSGIRVRDISFNFDGAFEYVIRISKSDYRLHSYDAISTGDFVFDFIIEGDTVNTLSSALAGEIEPSVKYTISDLGRNRKIERYLLNSGRFPNNPLYLFYEQEVNN